MLASVASASTTAPVFLTVPPIAPLPQRASYAINGATGASLTVGRFTVRVARGAYTGTSTFTIFIPDPNVLQCEITMDPVPASFKTKPSVEANYSGAAGTARYFWCVNFVPAQDKWAAAASSSVNTKTTLVTQAVTAFSKHGVVASKTAW